jgi:hypothetical protein
MNIDFHYGVIYIVSKLAGLSDEDAKIVAHSCQYVDDATVDGILEFDNKGSFERFASAHKLFDFKNELNSHNKLVWVPFHFLPGGIGETLEEKAICLPNSDIAKEMIRRAIEDKYNDDELKSNRLHRLGIALHTYVDTWAHQKFSGIKSHFNVVNDLESDDYHENFFKHEFNKIKEKIESKVVDEISKLGHGAALFLPDMPYATWNYKNSKGESVKRNNLPDFIDAANHACKVIQSFINYGNEKNDKFLNFESQKGISEEDRKKLENLLEHNKSDDAENRLHGLIKKSKSTFQITIPKYIAKGKNSWKYIATGILEDEGLHSFKALEDFIEPEAKWEHFEGSDYQKFHDAIKEQRNYITLELLPSHGIRLA